MSSTQLEVTRWTPKQLQEFVLKSAPKVAIFDCDGTLWSGDSGNGFMVWTIDQGLVSRSTSDWMDTRYRAYVAGGVSELQICGEMVQMYSGLHEQELRSAAARYFNEFVRPRIFEEVAGLVATLRKAGVELWAVSSTNKWLISEGVRDLGIPEERVLAAEVKVANEIITSEIVDVPTGPAKAAALRRVGLPRPDAVFGNSLHDLAMLEIAAHPYPVNPSLGLLEECAKRGWGYFRPREIVEAPAPVAGE
ncbi:MAG: haloacid dehalogenase-like hydrolase [Acidobacteria bacterium]|nr:haloacid dehalogenase-like hydrolase [Acidobacteriota bacterium]